MDRISRRTFLKSGLGVCGALFLGPSLSFLERALLAADSASGRSLVVIFQRGAADGLSIVPPVGDPKYRELRPSLALPESGEGAALRLDGFFGLHPALAPLMPFWESGQLAFVHQAGSPDVTRSHFDAQDYMESGVPGNKSVEDGYLNRAMQQMVGRSSSLRAVAVQSSMPRSLLGKFPALAMESIKDFGDAGLKDAALAKDFESMYRGAVDRALRGVGNEAFHALKTLNETTRKAASDEKESYPNGPLGKHLREIAGLVKADVGLQIGVTECGGWDTHVNQGAAQGQLATRLKELGQAVAAFARDLGPKLDRVVLVVLTEFGRTARENGNRGTDHGHGSVMMVLGGEVRGKRVYADWKGLADEALFERRDLPVLHDYRAVMGELLSHHLGIVRLQSVFPKFTPGRPLGLLRG